jgi:hypothetical protein
VLLKHGAAKVFPLPLPAHPEGRISHGLTMLQQLEDCELHGTFQQTSPSESAGPASQSGHPRAGLDGPARRSTTASRRARGRPVVHGCGPSGQPAQPPMDSGWATVEHESGLGDGARRCDTEAGPSATDPQAGRCPEGPKQALLDPEGPRPAAVGPFVHIGGQPAELLTIQAVLNPKVHGHTSRAPPIGIEPTSPPTEAADLMPLLSGRRVYYYMLRR